MQEKLTKKQKREAAREENKAKREKFNKDRKRRRVIIALSSVLGTIVVAGITTLIVVSSTPVEQLNPKNMLADAVVFQEGKVLTTEAIAEGSTPTPIELKDDRVEIELYFDYLCPFCKIFETTQSKVIEKYMAEKDVVVAFHPISSLGNYSLATSNAAACVASNEPDKWLAMHSILYSNQPVEAEGQSLSLRKSKNLTKELLSSLSLMDTTLDCIDKAPHGQWAIDSTTRVLSGKVPNSNLERLSGTPTIIIDGVKVDFDWAAGGEALDTYLAESLAKARAVNK
jgi:protein-disulfide isomerase